MDNEKLKIIVVDDNEIFRKGILFYLNKMLNFDIIEEFSDGNDFLGSQNLINADIVLMDIEMPKLNGIAAAKQALWRIPHLKIIAITNYKDKAYLTELIGAGFKGCVFKDNIYEELNNAINSVTAGEIYYPEDINL